MRRAASVASAHNAFGVGGWVNCARGWHRYSVSSPSIHDIPDDDQRSLLRLDRCMHGFACPRRLLNCFWYSLVANERMEARTVSTITSKAASGYQQHKHGKSDSIKDCGCCKDEYEMKESVSF